MTFRASTILVLCSLLLAGGWGVWKILDNNGIGEAATKSFKAYTAVAPPKNESNISFESKSRQVAVTERTARSYTEDLVRIKELLIADQFEEAVDQANSLYSSLNGTEATELKNLFIFRAAELQENNQPRRSLSLLKFFTQYFDDISAWELMGQLATTLKKWPTAVEAYTRYSLLEHRPELLEMKLVELTKVANLYRNDLQKHGDHLSVRDLFQNLYEVHPTNARFQLSLAEAQIAVNNIDDARQILNLLQYDPELGNLAKQVIDQLDEDAEKNKPEEVAEQPKDDSLPSDIVVPLRKVGTSFLANVSFSNSPVPMLLDTGASITSMSTAAIDRLGFEPIGRNIQISTANGLTSARLYRADTVRLGRFKIEGLVVAEIDLGRNGEFEGLLGTDLLNRVNQDYAYLIDNQKNELIFRRR